jgi:hypothetical protein
VDGGVEGNGVRHGAGFRKAAVQNVQRQSEEPRLPARAQRRVQNHLMQRTPTPRYIHCRGSKENAQGLKMMTFEGWNAASGKVRKKKQ